MNNVHPIFEQILKPFCPDSYGGKNGFAERFVFYWTDSVTGNGTKVYVESEAERDEILQHYFEASMGPVEGTRYNSEPVSWPGVIASRRAG